MSSKNEFKFSTHAPLGDITNYFSEILKSLKDKRVNLINESNSMSITPSESIEFEIYAERKKDKEKLSIELSWKLNNEEEDTNELVINSEELSDDNENDSEE